MIKTNVSVTYIDHSGFLVELDHTYLLFDFVNGTLPELDPEKQLLVFVSHRHQDHFAAHIFDMIKTHPKTEYLVSSDVNKKKVPEQLCERVIFMKANQTVKLTDYIEITTYRSTDEGVAFLVKAEGESIYHAGDLNDWRWEGEDKAWNNNMHANYLRELEKMKGTHIDVAFVPLDGRQGDLYYAGMEEFMEIVGADHVIPMHMWDDFSVIDKMKARKEAAGYADRIMGFRSTGEKMQIM